MDIQFRHYTRTMSNGSFERNAQFIGEFFCREAIRNQLQNLFFTFS